MFWLKLKKENKELKERIKNLEFELEGKNGKIAFKDLAIIDKDNKIDILQHNEMVLLEKNNELRNKNIDLENNIEFLFNNLSPQKKKLIRPS